MHSVKKLTVIFETQINTGARNCAVLFSVFSFSIYKNSIQFLSIFYKILRLQYWSWFSA